MKIDVNMRKNRLQYTEAAEKILKQMTLKEKVHLMSGNMVLADVRRNMANGQHYNEFPYEAGGNERLNVPSMKFVDGPRGAVTGRDKTTCFPVSMARGASFDTELEKQIGIAIAKEIKDSGGNFFGGVCINLPYNPGWGRSQEVYGEDSFLLGAMGSALSEGVQSESVVACVKHYAFNSMENARFKVDVHASKRTEREIYLSHFKDVIDSGAASVMTSYNKYFGEHTGNSTYLVRDVLKNEWNFDGFVISDFVNGTRDTVKAALAGLDIEMHVTNHYGEKLEKAVEDGLVPVETIDDAALRIIRTLLVFEEARKNDDSKETIDYKKHIRLALDAAEQSITLIKNENNCLPLNANIKKVAIFGKLATEENTGDRGSSRVYPPYVISYLEGLKKYSPHIQVIYNEGSDIELAKTIAREADAAIFVVGYNYDDEGEYTGEAENREVPAGAIFDAKGGDRKESLELHSEDILLINQVGPENNNSVVALVGGNTIMIEEWKNAVSAILFTYYSGMEGGTALAKILFGEANPSGKLPFVIPYKEKDLPQIDWNADQITYEYYHGYAKLEKEGKVPSIPFGYGLSYTNFDISNHDFTIDKKLLTAKCTVENTGKLPGAEVVQLYVGFSHSQIDRPIKVLRGFKKVHLLPGEKKNVTIKCPIEKLKWYNPDSEQWELEEIPYEVYLGNSSSPTDLIKETITV